MVAVPDWDVLIEEVIGAPTSLSCARIWCAKVVEEMERSSLLQDAERFQLSARCFGSKVLQVVIPQRLSLALSQDMCSCCSVRDVMMCMCLKLS